MKLAINLQPGMEQRDKIAVQNRSCWSNCTACCAKASCANSMWRWSREAGAAARARSGHPCTSSLPQAGSGGWRCASFAQSPSDVYSSTSKLQKNLHRKRFPETRRRMHAEVHSVRPGASATSYCALLAPSFSVLSSRQPRDGHSDQALGKNHNPQIVRRSYTLRLHAVSHEHTQHSATRLGGVISRGGLSKEADIACWFHRDHSPNLSSMTFMAVSMTLYRPNPLLFRG